MLPDSNLLLFELNYVSDIWYKKINHKNKNIILEINLPIFFKSI